MLVEVYKEQAYDEKVVLSEINKLKQKIDVLDERFAFGQIEKELYDKVVSKEKKAMTDLQKRLLQASPSSIPKIEQGIEESLQLALNIHTLWQDGDVYQRRRLQSLMFPKGLGYNLSKDAFVV